MSPGSFLINCSSPSVSCNFLSFRSPNIYYRLCNMAPLGVILSQFSPVYTLFNYNFTFIVPSMLWSPKCRLPYCKVNVKFPTLMKHHALEMSVEGGGIAPLCLSLDTKLKTLGSLTLRPAADWIGDKVAPRLVLLFAFARS